MRVRIPFRTILYLGCLARFAPAQAPSCLSLEGDRILARDLAAAVPALQSVPPATVLGSAPQPGAQRIFHAPELTAIARHYSLTLDNPADVCFAWPMEALAAPRVLESLRAALGQTEARIEIAELSSYLVPRGRLEFSRDRLSAPPEADRNAPVLWRGDVVYGESRRYPVWARVRIAAPCTRVIAAEPLHAGRPIEVRQLRIESATCFPGPEKTASAIEQVAGRNLLRPLAAGSPLRRDWLVQPNDVNRGDPVQVEVLSGGARLAFTGKAESAGHAGDLIAVRNLSSKKIFQARVDGPGKAVVLTGPYIPAQIKVE